MSMKDLTEVYACVDCGFFLANGMPDVHEEGWSPDLINEFWEGYVLINGESEKDHEFSWQPCDLCGSKLGGYRFHCVAWKEKLPCLKSYS